MGFVTCEGAFDVLLLNKQMRRSRSTSKREGKGGQALSTYHVTVSLEPTFQTVPVVGEVTGGTQTSLSDAVLRTTGAADADMPMTKEKRSATGDLKSIKVQRRLGMGAERKKENTNGGRGRMQKRGG
jgi:hypothetical protein